jgi:serine/threonine protein kinase
MTSLRASMLDVGARFAERYEVTRCIKAGAMGAVYEVLDGPTKRRRALKVMLPELVSDPDLRERFKNEATITAEIESEHLVDTFDAGVDAATGSPYLVMELLKGEDLQAALDRGPLAPAEVVSLLVQVTEALDKTHAAGIVHRDLKPENLFLTRRDGATLVKILDFGIAKVVSASAGARATRSVGTPLYMAPEQVRGEGDIGPSTDLYALGQIAFALLVGRAYWELEKVEGLIGLLRRIELGATEPATTRARAAGATLPDDFDLWFARATHPDKGSRHGSASELVTSLGEVLGVRGDAVKVAPRALESAGRISISTPSAAEPRFDAASETIAAKTGPEATRTLAASSSSVHASRERPGPRRARALAGVAVLGALSLGAWLAWGRASSTSAEPASAGERPSGATAGAASGASAALSTERGGAAEALAPTSAHDAGPPSGATAPVVSPLDSAPAEGPPRVDRPAATASATIVPSARATTRPSAVPSSKAPAASPPSAVKPPRDPVLDQY